MFKSQIEATLKQFQVTAKNDVRPVRCLFQVRPFTYGLAIELSSKLEKLFEDEKPADDVKSYSPILEIPRQTVTFKAHPDAATPGGVIKAVDIQNLQILRSTTVGGRAEFRLLFDAKFTISDRAVASRLQLDFLGQSVFLSFEADQKKLFEHDRSLEVGGSFINDRARQGRAGLGVPRPPVRGGGSTQVKGDRL